MEIRTLSKPILLFLFLQTFSWHYLNAQSCCSGGVPLSSSIGIAPQSSGVFQSLLISDINQLKTFKRGTRKLEDSFRERRTTSLLFLNSYTFSDRFSADLTVSWVEQFRRVEGFGNIIDTEKSSGIGDVVFLAKYRLTDPENQTSAVFVGSGIKLPTGDSNQTNDDGIVMNLDMQPGSGSLDELFWVYYSRGFANRPTATFYSSNLFQLTGTYGEFNRIQQYKVGNNLVSRVGFTNNVTLFNKLFDAIIEVIFRKNWKDKVDDQILPNTGGQWIFLKPGASWIASPKFSLNFGFEIPLYANVVGEQLSSTNRISIQLIFKSGNKANVLDF